MQRNLFISNFKRLLAVLIFVILLFTSCSVAQRIIKDKFLTDATTIVNGFYAEEKNSIDVVFVGSSNCFCSIDPSVLYEEYGIAAYNFASSSQTMNLSLLYVKEMFKRQKPKVVALEVNYLPQNSLQDVSDSSLMWGLTDMPMSLDKIKCLSQCRSTIDGEYISYLFPVLRYHTRWKDLYKKDFVYRKEDKTCYTKGYMGSQDIYTEMINFPSYYEEGYSWIEDDVMACFQEIYDLCKKNGAELILFKSPREGWYQYETTVVQELADIKQIPYVDYNLLTETLGLQDVQYFRDYEHLNDAGAYIVTKDFGEKLKMLYPLPDRRTDEKENAWDRALAYKKRLQEQPFMYATSVKECYALIDQQEGYVTVVTYKGGINPQTLAQIKPHQWVYRDHKLVMEQEWHQDGVREYNMGQQELVLHCAGALVQVLIGNLDYEVMSSDWSIVVYDEMTQKVVANLKYDL